MSTTAAAFGPQERAMPWWIPLIEGILLVIVGILLFTNTRITIEIIALILGVYWLISGIMELVSLFVDRSAWGLKLLGSIIGIWAGIIVLRNPLTGAVILGLAFVVFLGIQALLLGVVNIVQAFRGAGWGIGLMGIINIIFGIFLLSNTLLATATLAWVMGGFAVVAGIVAIVTAYRLKTT